MNAMRRIVLGLSMCMLISTAACEQPSKGDPMSPTAAKGREAGPGWSVGWSRLKAGMDAVEVLTVLDQPAHITVTMVNTTWYYSDRQAEGPHVVFDTQQMRVERWRSPQ